MKNLMMFAALLAAGCAASTTQVPLDDEPLPTPGEACEPEALLGCADDIAATCSSDGVVTTTVCEAGCNADAARCNECVPGTSTCGPSSALTCGADGVLATSENCALGCDEGDGARCKHIVPAFLPTACDTPADTALELSENINSDVDANCTGGIAQPANGPEICIVHHQTITIATVAVTGRRAIAFVADNDLLVPGFLDVSANGSTSGPGGGRRVSGLVPTGAAGGTGAGFKQVGGKGGTKLATNSPAGGSTFDPLQTGIFEGGSRSPGVSPALCGAGEFCSRGGGGGGALMLVSCRGTVKVTGAIHAGGGGGGAGGDKTRTTQGMSLVGGAGGGAGGYVVIQGARVEVAAGLLANGGGGGGSCDFNDCVGAPGEDAVLDGGGRGGINTANGLGTAGGFGGRNTTLPGNGDSLDFAVSFGGGGGSVGRIQLYTPSNSFPTVGAQSVIQPPLEAIRTIQTR